jgi:hypothetical protein
MRGLWVLLALAAVYAFFWFRISAFRVDRPRWERQSRYFGVPDGGLTGLAIFDRDSYTPDGQRFYPWLIGSFCALAFAALLVLVNAAFS